MKTVRRIGDSKELNCFCPMAFNIDSIRLNKCRLDCAWIRRGYYDYDNKAIYCGDKFIGKMEGEYEEI